MALRGILGTPMRLRIILATRACVKVLGSCLDAAIARGHELDIVMRPRAFRERVLTTDFARWPSKASPYAQHDATLSVRLEDFACGDWGLRVVVPLFAEFLMRDFHDYDDVLLCYPSQELAQRHSRVFIPGLSVTGWTTADHATMGIERPRERDLHIFFSMKCDVPRQARVNYFRIALADRRSAHERGLKWVVKTRIKHKDPWWLRHLADAYMGDDIMYPHTSQFLLTQAASMSHFTSGAVAEAVLHNVPTLWYRRADHRHHLQLHQRQPDEYLQPWLMSRENYVKRFLGWDDGQNGARVIEAIEQRVT